MSVYRIFVVTSSCEHWPEKISQSSSWNGSFWHGLGATSLPPAAHFELSADTTSAVVLYVVVVQCGLSKASNKERQKWACGDKKTINSKSNLLCVKLLTGTSSYWRIHSQSFRLDTSIPSGVAIPNSEFLTHSQSANQRHGSSRFG